TEDQEHAAVRSIESLIARNALALRIAAAGAMVNSRSDPCAEALQALATAPAITRRFSLRGAEGQLLCTAGGFQPKEPIPLVAPGDIKIWLDQNEGAIDIRVGVMGGMATASLPSDEIRSAALETG